MNTDDIRLCDPIFVLQTRLVAAAGSQVQEPCAGLNEGGGVSIANRKSVQPTGSPDSDDGSNPLLSAFKIREKELLENLHSQENSLRFAGLFICRTHTM